MIKGFTLIEIIVVLIIFGALTSLSLTSYFSWIEKSRAAEATEQIKNLNALVLGCMQVKTINECRDFGVSNTISTHFNYSVFGCTNSAATPCWLIVAYRNNFENSWPFNPSDMLKCNGITGGIIGTGLILCHNTDSLGTDQINGAGPFK